MAELLSLNNIGYDTLPIEIRDVINQSKDFETGIHIVNTPGPAYHVIMLKYSPDYYSLIITTYGGDRPIIYKK